MANKKFGKLLAFAAITGAAIAAGIAYFNRKKESEDWDDELDDFDDDFDDEDFDFPIPDEHEESSVKREYVSLNMDKEEDSKIEEIDAQASNQKEDQTAAADEESSEDVEKTV
jgi:hypothetical protein